MNFKDLLMQAKQNYEAAIRQLGEMYKPLLLKESIVDGVWNEDLYQELWITLLRRIEKFQA